MAGGGGKSPSSTTQTQELPAWARGYAKDVLAKGAALTDINQNPYVSYGGQRLAGFDPMQQQSYTDAQNMSVAPQIGQATQMATQAGQYNPADFQNQYNNQLQQYTGANVNQYMNPYLEGALAPQLREAASTGLQAQNMNAAKAVGQGAFGGTRGALQQSMTEKNTMQNMADINAKGYSDAFNQAAGMFSADQQRQMQDAQLRAQYGLSADQAREQSRQFGAGQGLNAAQLLSTLGGQQFQQGMDINKLRNTYGQQKQSQAQKADDIAYQNFLDQQNYAYKQLGFMSDLIKNPAIGSSTQRQMYENNSGNDLATLGGLGALGKGAGLFREGGMVGYADGGDITSYVKRLSDQQLAEAYKQAQQEQDQERIMALMAEIQYRQEVRGAQAMPPPQEQPMDQGLAALPAGPMPQMASGGIVAFAGDAESLVKGDKKKEFLEVYGPVAEVAGKQLGVDSRILLGQWALESDYGRKTVGEFNVGNMKAGKKQEGTRGYDKIEKSNDKYLNFKDPEEFGAAYVDRIKRLFPNAVDAGNDIGRFTAGLKTGKTGVYATDPKYGSKLSDAYRSFLTQPDAVQAQNAGLAGSAPAQNFAAYAGAADQIPGTYRDPRQDFRGPPAPPAPDKDFGGLGRMLGLGEGILSLGVNAASPLLAAAKTMLGNDKTLDENLEGSVFTPFSETGRGFVQKVGETAEDLKIPAVSPLIGRGGQSLGAIKNAQKSAAAATKKADITAAAAAAAAKKVELPRLPGATTSAAEAKVAAPRLQASPKVEGPPGQMLTAEAAEAARIDKAAADWTAARSLRQDKKAAADAQAARQSQGTTGLKQDKADAANTGLAATRAAEEARLGPIKVQDETLRAMDRGDEALYAQGAANRLDQQGRRLLGASVVGNASDENMPSGLGSTAAAAAAEDLSKGDKKDVVDAAKKAVPDSMKKDSGFTNDDWLMLGLQMLKNNVGQKGFGQILGESGLPTLMNKKEREKMEREQESQGFVDQYRQSQAELNRAQAEFYGSGTRQTAAAAKEANDTYESWLKGLSKIDEATIPQAQKEAKRIQLMQQAFARYNLPMPAGLSAGAPAAVPEGTKVTRIG